MNLTKYLPDIKDKILSWAKVDCLKHVGYATKNRVICMDCGQKFSPEIVSRKRAVCPRCNTKLIIETSKCRTNKQDIYIAIADVYGEFQVIRNFELKSSHRVDWPTEYTFHEILQHWILPNGKREVIARNHTTNWNVDSWNGNMEIRTKSNERKYDVYPIAFHPDSEFKPEYLKIGINYHLQGLTALEAIQNIPTNQKTETLLKAKQYGLLEISDGHDYKIGAYWDSIKICMRNKYIVKDGKMWTDYIDLLRYFKKDMLNAHFVCPKDLKKQHDIYVVRKTKAMKLESLKQDYIRILRYFGEVIGKDFVYPKNLNKEYQILVERQKLDKLEKRAKELSELDIKYREFILKFLDMEFVDKDIRIIPLANIDEFKAEADILHHCVYSNEYFKKKDCLILSARLGDERLETIEINLKSNKVVQCRGNHNSNSEYHDRKLGIVNRNIKHIRTRVKQKQTS